MKLPTVLINALRRRADRIAAQREPDFIIGGAEDPYLRRWWMIPRNWLFNIYLHELVRSDDDRALHDHPWLNCSILIDGAYVEHTIEAGGVNRRVMRRAGEIKLRRAIAAHRLEIVEGQNARSIFITGPRLRSWGFHCRWGWRRWQDFCQSADDLDGSGRVGRGCD